VFEHLEPQKVRLTAVAARAQMTHPAMSELVRDLEEMGYVSRTTDPTDGRARLVRLTHSGRQLQRLALDLIAEIEDRWLARFTANSSPDLHANLRHALEVAATEPTPRLRPEV
jgi:DNA-binding MarR family transcriptional regulator